MLWYLAAPWAAACISGYSTLPSPTARAWGSERSTCVIAVTESLRAGHTRAEETRAEINEARP